MPTTAPTIDDIWEFTGSLTVRDLFAVGEALDLRGDVIWLPHRIRFEELGEFIYDIDVMLTEEFARFRGGPPDAVRIRDATMREYAFDRMMNRVMHGHGEKVGKLLLAWGV